MIAWLVVLAVPAPTLAPSELLRDVGDRAPLVVMRGAEVDVARAQVGVAGAWDDASLSIMGESILLPDGNGLEPGPRRRADRRRPRAVVFALLLLLRRRGRRQGGCPRCEPGGGRDRRATPPR